MKHTQNNKGDNETPTANLASAQITGTMSSLLEAFVADAGSAALNLAAQDDPASPLMALSAGEIERVWQALAPVVASSLVHAKPAMQASDGSLFDDVEGEDSEAAEIVETALDTLSAIALLARSSILDKDREVPEILLDIVVELHDIIFDLCDPRAMALQSSIVELCEVWWLGERDGRDDLVPQTVSYMLVRVLHNLASTADVKRLYAFRSALQVLDYGDESVRPLQRLLLHAAIQPLVLRCPEGRKLVAYFFSLHAPFVAELHRSIKSQVLPISPKSHAQIL